MVWDPTPPVFIGQMRIQVAQCASWITACGDATIGLGRLHYPSLDFRGEKGAPDQVVAGLITRTEAGRRRWLEGAGGLVSGSLDLDVYVPALTSGLYAKAYTVGQLEDFADTLIQELLTQRTGIPFRDIPKMSEASNPTNAEIAAHSDDTPSAFRWIRITMPYGLNS